ncbi:DEAD/DEAH box helicase [Rarobacter faecitabidus]|uniref:ATP-dependent RNA helicase HelY n=1 Tax=Rarobacter faecitabidus TaxID=13243 RepID=A0A542ZVW9_RARFA|nr:DEAD/DEAH box helicase [Rarobacter faecitabidus]TQL64396.1 ATP-dependent RNA helicase HelY [Rarobacter faecitabidus]
MEDLSPAERYQRDRIRRAFNKSAAGQFAATLAYALDDFQRAGCASVERGASVLVAAPTGAGKTVVGEFAIFLALRQGKRAFYTTPIKALSNQKYRDLVDQHGEASVGLLTGDTTINGDAPIVVMTTEVLRNMLYAGSSALDTLGFVVMDEVHYLADRFRGPVWEEVILHLSQTVQLVCLSATVSNVEEFGAWLTEVRGETDLVVSDHRPVPLWQHVVTARRGDDVERGGGVRQRVRLIDLYAYGNGSEADADEDSPPTAFTRGAAPHSLTNGRELPINPELRATIRVPHAPARGGRGGPPPSARRRQSVPRFATVDLLDSEDLLPAIYFIFSRNGCQIAVEQCLAAGLALTSDAEAAQIRRIVDERTAGVPPADLAILDYGTWSLALERGIAAHHAGLLPLFKEIVEQLFVLGLVKVVFATETLALGINMPARTVVLEKLDKWDGSAHVDISPGEYTQLTGRAGRRGIDVEGHAVIVDHPGLDPEALAGLASTRTYPLRSSFRPTYNMAANLVSTVGVQRTRDVLEMSFAQFQADRSVVGLARQAAEQQQAMAGYERAMTCDRGDAREYFALRDRISLLEKESKRERGATKRTAISRQIEQLRRGDVIEVFARRRSSFAVVLERPEPGFEGSRVAVFADGRIKQFSVTDAPEGLAIVGRARIPKGFNARNTAAKQELAKVVKSVTRGAKERPTDSGGRNPGGAAAPKEAQIRELRQALRAHPCHSCPDLADHERWANRWRDLNAQHERLLRRIEGRTGTIAIRFDKICAVLQKLGYLVPEGEGLALTEAGATLRRLYSEKDLLIAQCLRAGIWDELTAPGLASVVAATIYEGRRETAGAQAIPGGPQGKVADSLDGTFRVWSKLADVESAAGLEPTLRPDFGIVGPVHRWAAGRNLDAALRDTELAAGDFVRWCKQVIDVLDQIAGVAPTSRLRATARTALDALRRGVVAY